MMRFEIRSLAACLVAGAVWLGCGGDGGGNAETPEPAASPSGAAPAAGPTGVSIDLHDVPWAVALEVNLDDMDLQPSGLYVQVLAEGQGPRAVPGDSLGIHYTVWLPNGDKLDSSYDHNPPDALPMVLGVTSLIDGWTEGVTGMRRGERRRLVLPHDLAYGPAGRRGVPPYSPLLFEVELAEHEPGGR